MEGNFFSLTKDKQFGPLFLVQLLGAFHDNLFRSTLLMMVTFGVGVMEGVNTLQLTTAIGGITILPFLVFSSIAGQLADKFDKCQLVRILKGCEIGVMVVALYGLMTLSLNILFVTLFLTMVQSSFFGPLKYSLIPSLLPKDKIINANALVESSTFLAILAGTMLGAFLVTFGSLGKIMLGILLLASTGLSFFLSLRLPKNKPAAPDLKLNWNLYRETISIVQYAAKDRTVFLAIIGISWFWVIGMVMLTQIGSYGKETIGGNEQIATFFLFLFTIGIGLGSYGCNKIMGSEIDPRVITWGAIATTLFMIDLVITSYGTFTNSKDIFGFLSTVIGWHISLDLLLIAFATGLSWVPLYAIMQTRPRPDHCSRVVAANNIMNSFFMMSASLVTMVLIHLNVTIINIFLIVALLTIFMTHRLSVLVRESILQLILQAILKLVFRVEVKGLEHYHRAGDKVLIVANHVSFIDAVLIFAFIPDQLTFAIYSHYIDWWWIRVIRFLHHGLSLFPVDPTNPLAVRKLIEAIRNHKKCVIFPEGRISITGSLMKVFDGPGMIADRSGAQVLPIRIDGAQYSLFSRLRGKVKRTLFPKITLHILPPRTFDVSSNLTGKERRQAITSQLLDVMQQMTFETSSYQQTLTQSLFESARRYGMGMEIIEDFQRRPLTYRTFILRLFILGGWIKNHTAPKEQVGILLPTSSASTVSFFALLLVGRVPTLLNFSLGERVLMNTCDLAQARLVLTSRDFVKRARLETTIHHLKKQTKVFYLEDIKGETGFVERIKGLVFSYFPEWASREDQESITPQDPAAILFTSGSEGFPKGVVLSHENLNANRYQITSMIDLNPQDVLLNVLPTFHAFGLTAGMLTPLLTGIRSFQYPSPLHYRIIPVISYEIDATIFFGTDTFLHKYALCAHPYDFYSMRYVVSGAEHLREETRKLWLDKFGIQLYNAYGATEASPAVALNTRMQNQRGTVGRFVPGIQHVISPLEGMEGSGRLCIKGPNVMMGYIDPETKKIVPPAAPLEEGGDLQPGWYDTGDIVSIDSQGFVTIQDRSKRFAKVAGEMISLTAVEHRLYEAFPGYQHLVLAVPDPRKGEQLVVLTTADLTREQVLQAFREKGYGELMMPRTLFRVDAIPLLPTGKTDFGKAKLMLQELMGFLD